MVRVDSSNVKCTSLKCGMNGSLKCAHARRYHADESEEDDEEDEEIISDLQEVVVREKKRQTRIAGYTMDLSTGDLKANCMSVREIDQNINDDRHRQIAFEFIKSCRSSLDDVILCDEGKPCLSSGCSGSLRREQKVVIT